MIIARMEALAHMPAFTFDDYASELKQSLKELEDNTTTMQRAQLFADKMRGGNISTNLEKQKAFTAETVQLTPCRRARGISSAFQCHLTTWHCVHRRSR